MVVVRNIASECIYSKTLRCFVFAKCSGFCEILVNHVAGGDVTALRDKRAMPDPCLYRRG